MPPLERDELRAAFHARQELGEHLERDVIDAFLEKVEHQIDVHVDARVDQRVARLRTGARERANNFTGRIAASLGIGIPLTAIAGGIGQVPGIVAVWAGIVALNIYYSEVERRGD